VEQGFKDLGYVGWFGFYVAARTPADTVQRLNGAIRQALAAPEVVDSLAGVYLEPMPTSPQQLATLLRTESDFWGGLVKSVGYTPEA
jgi:tripartite-type tricarboxylate transporter receptor subunit TctC